MFKAVLKYFGRLKEADRRIKLGKQRLKAAQTQIAMLEELIDTLRTSDETTCKMMAATLTSLNHHMQRGDEWAPTYQWHLSKLTNDVATFIPEFAEKYKTVAEEDGQHVNFDANPVFDFPIKPGEVYVRPRDKHRVHIHGVLRVKDLQHVLPTEKAK